MNTRLDHIVVAASSLDQGEAYIRELLGVTVPSGGRHEMMGTWNRVMSLGNGVYLEVISINPSMDAPSYPRWFGLDDPYVRSAIAHQPRLITWAVNCDSLDTLVSSSLVPLGAIKEAQRDNLKWKVAISEDGRMPGSGFIPLCIEWLVDFHPSEKMQFLQCELQSMTLYHPKPKWLESALISIGAQKLVNIEPIEDGLSPYMEVVLASPNGSVTISSKFEN